MEESAFLRRMFGDDSEYLIGEPERLWLNSKRAKGEIAATNIGAFVLSFLVFCVVPLLYYQNIWLIPFTIPICLVSTWFLYYRIKIRLVRSAWARQESGG